MPDTLYIGDIPAEYHYVQFTNDYVTLYNKPSAKNETLDFYRIYYNFTPGTYITGTQTFGNYNTTTFTDYPVSNSVWDRPDLSNILTCTFILAFFGIMLINLITSIFRKNGILSGLF